MVRGIQLLVPRRRIGVAVVVFDEAGRLLLLRHVLHPVYPWGLPGGWLNRGEAPQAGAQRELWEETGLRAEIGPVLCVQQEKYPDHIAVAYLAQVHSGPLRLSAEIMEAKWCTANQCPSPLLPFHKQAVETAVARFGKGFAFIGEASANNE